MFDVSIETEDEHTWKVVASAVAFVLGLLVGGTLCWVEGCWAGVIGFVLAQILPICVWSVIRQTWLRSRTPADAIRAAKVVGRWFVEQHPRVPVNEWIVRAVEPYRYIIAVSYCEGTPRPPRRYFAISRPDLNDIAELPQSDWEKPWWIEETDQPQSDR
jgi:hypothetical protein